MKSLARAAGTNDDGWAAAGERITIERYASIEWHRGSWSNHGSLVVTASSNGSGLPCWQGDEMASDDNRMNAACSTTRFLYT